MVDNVNIDEIENVNPFAREENSEIYLGKEIYALKEDIYQTDAFKKYLDSKYEGNTPENLSRGYKESWLNLFVSDPERTEEEKELAKSTIQEAKEKYDQRKVEENLDNIRSREFLNFLDAKDFASCEHLIKTYPNILSSSNMANALTPEMNKTGEERYQKAFEVLDYLDTQKKAGVLTQEQLSAYVNQQSNITGETLTTSLLKDTLNVGDKIEKGGLSLEEEDTARADFRTQERLLSRVVNGNGYFQASMDVPNKRGQYPLTIVDGATPEGQLNNSITTIHNAIRMNTSDSLDTSSKPSIATVNDNELSSTKGFVRKGSEVPSTEDVLEDIKIFDITKPAFLTSETENPLSIANIHQGGRNLISKDKDGKASVYNLNAEDNADNLHLFTKDNEGNIVKTTANDVFEKIYNNSLTPEDVSEISIEDSTNNELTPDDIEHQDSDTNLEEKTPPKVDEEGKGVKARRKDNLDDTDKDEDKKGPFQEGDIIDYMYKEWLIAAANWCYVKVAKKLKSWGTSAYIAFLEGRENRRIKAAENAAKGKTKDTLDYYGNTEGKIAGILKKQNDFFKHNADKMGKAFEDIAAGNFENLNLSGMSAENKQSLMAKLNGMSKKDREAFGNKSKEAFSNMATNFEIVSKIAGNYVASKLGDEKANDKTFPKESVRSLEVVYIKETMATIFAQCNKIQKEGGSPTDVFEYLEKLKEGSEKAKLHTDRQINRNLVNEHNVNPAKNKERIKLESLIKGDGNINTNTKEIGLFEELSKGYVSDEGKAKVIESIIKSKEDLERREEENNNRRDNVDRVNGNEGGSSNGTEPGNEGIEPQGSNDGTETQAPQGGNDGAEPQAPQGGNDGAEPQAPQGGNDDNINPENSSERAEPANGDIIVEESDNKPKDEEAKSDDKTGEAKKPNDGNPETKVPEKNNVQERMIGNKLLRLTGQKPHENSNVRMINGKPLVKNPNQNQSTEKKILVKASDMKKDNNTK